MYFDKDEVQKKNYKNRNINHLPMWILFYSYNDRL